MEEKLIKEDEHDGGSNDRQGQKNLTNRKLVGQERLLDYFLEAYSSAYTVNLLDDSFEILHMAPGMSKNFTMDGKREDMLKFIDNHIHPDDRELMLQNIDKEYVINRLKKEKSYTFVVREVFGPVEKTMKCLIICCPDEYHIAVGFMDISEELRREQNRLLGTVPLSLDILTKANIGLWAFELDEGKPPRMYVDEAMLGLVGLKHQVSPEETYHAWYDHIDKDSYGLVNDAVVKMVAGEHAEVQYPWHHPDGHTMVVRCGGVRNFNYKAGFRIEGTHQNVSEVLHFDEEKIAHLKKAEVELQHEQFLSDSINEFVVNNEADPVELLKKYAERLRVLIGCDQVIYRGSEETQILVNNPVFAEEWIVPIEYCRQCQHYSMNNPVYKEGYAEMEDCHKGWRGIPIHEKCPVKSSLTRVVYCDGEPAGYLAIHYLLDFHQFSDVERRTLKEITRILSISLSRYKARTENKELRQIAEMQDQLEKSLAFTNYFLGTYVSAYYIGLDDESCKIYKRTDELEKNYPNITSYLVSINEYIKQDVHPDDRKELEKIIRPKNLKAVLQENPELVHVFRDISGGVEKIYRLQIIRGADNAHAALGFKDITEEVAEENRRQRELAEALESAKTANESKSSFLFNMSHDIRTPMNAITGFTSMAKKYITDEEKVADYLNKIDSSGQQLLTLVNQVLEMSRIESGKIEFDNQPVSIKEKFDSFVTILSAQADVNDLEFNASLDVKHNYVMVDEARMSQIVLNITGNALKYTPHGGKIDFSFREIPCDKEGWGRYVFSVADNGIGMSEEFQKTLFEPFSREKTSTVSKIQGTGLGMSIVKNIVDLLGGKIEVQSKAGEGTRFDITFDLEITAAVEKTAAEENKLEPSFFEGKRILLVEDNELNREIAKDILGEFGVFVEEADDGDVAVEKVKESAARGEHDYYNLILMDVQMPRMNGYEATRAIRAIPDTTGSYLPIIAMTANAFEEDRKNALLAGMDEHLAKPIEIDKLLMVLARFL